jgi:uncharacterized protein YcbX
MESILTAINCFPVKGLSAQSLPTTTLDIGQPIAGDRRFALARGGVPITISDDAWRNKGHFLQLSRHARLATLVSHFDAESEVLTIYRRDRQVSCGKISEPLGRALIEQFFTAYLSDSISAPPKLIDGKQTSFSDQREGLLSLINLASLHDIERVTGEAIDGQRFRGNLVIDGAAAWAENTWIGQTVHLGDARLTVVEPIERCAAINVNPNNGQRDMNLVRDLERGFGHRHCGVFLRVVQGGKIATKDHLTISAPAPTLSQT